MGAGGKGRDFWEEFGDLAAEAEPFTPFPLLSQIRVLTPSASDRGGGGVVVTFFTAVEIISLDYFQVLGPRNACVCAVLVAS